MKIVPIPPLQSRENLPAAVPLARNKAQNCSFAHDANQEHLQNDQRGEAYRRKLIGGLAKVEDDPDVHNARKQDTRKNLSRGCFSRAHFLGKIVG